MKTEIRKLRIDLSTRTTQIEVLPASQASLEERLGGFGLAVHDFAKRLEQTQDLRDAYDTRAPIFITTGFLTGAKVSTARRTYICGLSPQKTSLAGTNGIYYSAASGDLGPKISGLGFDSIEIVGRSNTPVYLVLDKGGVHFEDATQLLGKTTNERVLLLAEKHAHPTYAYAVTGPAAEKGVRFANVAFSTFDQIKNKSGHMRFAGRGGMGAALASKNLLGIVAGGGDAIIDVGDVVGMNREIAAGKRTLKYRMLGTYFGNNETMEMLGVNPHNNFSRGSDPRTSVLFKPKLREAGFEIKDKACLGCSIKCWKEINKGNEILGKVDFEAGMLLGPNLGVYNTEQTMELIRITDLHGVDAITAGVCLGYEMEQQKKFGDFEFAKGLLLKIVSGEHPLKEGLMRYAGNAPNAMHVKGMEMAAYPGNFNPGYAFAIAGPHMSMDTYNGAWYPKATNDAAEWIDNVIRGPQIVLYDMNGTCKFAKLTFNEIAELYSRVFGMDRPTEDEMRSVAKQVYGLARGIDSQLGFTEADDTLPARCFEDYGSRTVRHFNTQAFFEQVKAGVYERLAQANA